MKATHNVKAYRNSMDSTSGRAPFLGTYISHENVPMAALCEQVAAQSGLTAIQARAIIEGAFDAIAELEKDGLVIVHLDGMSVWAVITGSFPTGDAAFDPERNALNLAIRLDDSLRLALVHGEDDDDVNLGGCDVYVAGEHLDGATAVEYCATEDGEAFYTMDAAYDPETGRLSGHADFVGSSPQRGFARVTTPGGTATHAVEFSNH